MDKQTLSRATRHFAELRTAIQPALRVPDELNPKDMTEAYDIQDALSAVLAEDKGPVAGHKIGCTTPVMQDFLNINHPCAGRLYAGELYDGDVTLRLSDYVAIGVECEMALQLGADLPPGGAPYTAQTVLDAVESVSAAAELVDNRYKDFHDFGVPALAADDFFSCGAVLGAPHADVAGMDLSKARGTTFVNGAEAGSGLGDLVMGNPLNALAWIANLKAERGQGLKKGDVIMTGSMVETQWIDKPGEVICRVEPFGEVRMRFV